MDGEPKAKRRLAEELAERGMRWRRRRPRWRIWSRSERRRSARLRGRPLLGRMDRRTWMQLRRREAGGLEGEGHDRARRVPPPCTPRRRLKLTSSTTQSRYLCPLPPEGPRLLPPACLKGVQRPRHIPTSRISTSPFQLSPATSPSPDDPPVSQHRQIPNPHRADSSGFGATPIAAQPILVWDSRVHAGTSA